ncbi:MAG: HD domain-containing protein [Phycisphaeraceae bacterium]|nr:HD domain-containing protein [Phycisphaeraceae bacterium]
MEILPVASIRAGQVFDRPLYSPRGLLLLAPGSPVSADLLERLRRLRPAQVTLADAQQDHTAPDYAEPTNDDTEPEPEPDPDTARRRALRRVWEFQRLALRTRASLRRAADELVQSHAGLWSRLPRRISPQPAPMREFKNAGNDESLIDLTLGRPERVRIIDRIYARLLDAQRVRATPLRELVDELADAAERHADRFALVALPGELQSLSVADHAYRTAALAVAIARQLAWGHADIRAAGLAALLADSGMLLLPTDLRAVARPLTEVESNALKRHPAYSVALASHVLELPESVSLAVYQHHEREDGSGYPLALRTPTGPNANPATSTISDLARVVAVADTLAAASQPRAHRPGLTPHAAVQAVVREAAAGRLDKATARAAVRAVGLFPAGSRVRLSGGELALVESLPDPTRADRPVVRLIEREEPALELKPDVLDLAAEPPEIRVVEALAGPATLVLPAAV